MQAQADWRHASSGFLVGAGPSVPTGAVGYRTLVFAAYRLEYPIPLPRDHAWIADGHWAYQMEVPVFAFFQDSKAVAIGGTPIGFRYTMRSHQHLRPFFGGLAGLLYATRPVPEGASRFNFTPQAEAGLSVATLGRRRLDFEVRYLHISNGSLHHPNPGINTVLFLFGRTF